jgi:hypothetical protein
MKELRLMKIKKARSECRTTTKIVDALGEKDEKRLAEFNLEIKAMADGNLILKAAQDELAALVLESGLTAEELSTGSE